MILWIVLHLLSLYGPSLSLSYGLDAFLAQEMAVQVENAAELWTDPATGLALLRS